MADLSQIAVVNNGLGRHFVVLSTIEKLAFDEVGVAIVLFN